jgi:hypothetical protein
MILRKIVAALVPIVLVVAPCGGLHQRGARAGAVPGPSAPHRAAAAPRIPAYAVGSPDFADIYAGPAGDDEAGDGSQARPFRTIQRAWRAVEHDAQDRRTRAYRIRLLPGEYHGAYLDRATEEQPSLGSLSTPLVIESADPFDRARVIYDPVAARGNLTLFKLSYVYLLGFDIRMDLTYRGAVWGQESGDGFQCEQCDHLLLRDMVVRGYFNTNLAESMGQSETVKLNQSTHVYIEDSDIGGAGDNAIDAVAVRHGWWVRNRIHTARDWCAYAKGGSADILVAGNEMHGCGTGGFIAGQGTTLVFLRAPFLQYEAYHIKVLNNIIHDVRGAGLGVNGGFNILMAYNTLYRVGDDDNRNHMLELAPGARDCAGPPQSECDDLLDAGAWGTSQPDVNAELVPNRNVFILNNLVYNPTVFRAPMRVFRLDGPRDGAGSGWRNGPLPATFDEGVVVRGNVIWTGTSGSDFELGAGDSGQGCQPSNPSCNPSQLAAENMINSAEPQLVNPAGGDYRPVAGGSLATAPPAALPAFDPGALTAEQQTLVQVVNPLVTSMVWRAPPTS